MEGHPGTSETEKVQIKTAAPPLLKHRGRGALTRKQRGVKTTEESQRARVRARRGFVCSAGAPQGRLPYRVSGPLVFLGGDLRACPHLRPVYRFFWALVVTPPLSTLHWLSCPVLSRRLLASGRESLAENVAAIRRRREANKTNSGAAAPRGA